MTIKMNEFQLADLQNLVRLPSGKAAMYIEACVWCMDQHGHPNGVELEVQYGKKNISFPVCWPEENLDLQKIRNHYTR